MRLLKIADKEIGELDQHFESSHKVNIEQVSPKVLDNSKKVDIGEKNLAEFDAVFANIPVQNAVFGRVMLEMIEEKGLNVNYSSTAFFTMAKKNYLLHVLKQKNIVSPKTAVIADGKAARNLEEHLKGPLEARRIKDLEQTESKKIDSVEGIQEFAEGTDYGEEIMIFSELSEGEKYRCMVAGEEVFSLKDSSDDWKISEDNLAYSNLPTKLEERVRSVMKALGAGFGEVLLRDGEVVDVNPNPSPEKFKQISGKNTYEAVADNLKGS
jgi:hypothetical protein